MARQQPQRPPLEQPPQAYPAEKARQGRIVLRKTWQRVVFFGGLALAVIAVLVWGW